MINIAMQAILSRCYLLDQNRVNFQSVAPTPSKIMGGSLKRSKNGLFAHNTALIYIPNLLEDQK